MFRRLVRWAIRMLATIGVLVGIALLSDYFSSRVAANSVVVVTLRGSVIERATPGLFGMLSSRQTALNVVRRAIDQARTDKRVAGLAIKVIDPHLELAQAQELVAAINAFRETGKWSAAYIETAGEFAPGHLPYMVAAAAGEVSMMPQGDLNLVGVAIREIFARGTLEWLGVRPNFSAIGDYKTAGNIFTQRDFTPAQKEQDEALVGSIFDQVVAATAEARSLDRESVVSLINQAPLSPRMGLEAKLIDRIEYEDEFVARIKQRDGTRHPLVDYAAYARPRLVSAVAFADRIAVIYGVGAIQRGEGGFDPMSPEAGSMGSDEIVRAFRRARNDDSVRAVVFRVNSPGGSALASELIRRQVKLTADKKPVVVSMSGYAASGGYWIAAPAQKIFAEPGTITGSIGVLGGKFNVAPAAEKVRLNTGIVKRGENVSMFDMFSDFTPEQARLFHDRYISDTYQNFLKIVSEGRNMPVAEVDKIAQGRVWTGEQALGLKLIDGIGGLNEAIAEARALAKIAPDAEIALVELPQPPSVLQRLARGPLGGQQSWEDAAAFRAFGPLWNILRAALDADGVFSAVYCTVVPIL